VDAATTTSIGFRDPRRVPGKLLFEALFPREVVEQAKKDMGSAGRSAPATADSGRWSSACPMARSSIPGPSQRQMSERSWMSN